MKDALIFAGAFAAFMLFAAALIAWACRQVWKWIIG